MRPPAAGRAALRASWRRGRRVWWLLRKVCAGRVHPPELLRSARCLHRRLGRVRRELENRVSVSQVKSAGATESALPLLAGPRSEHLFLAGRGAAPDLEQLLLPEGAQRPCTAEHLWSCSGCCGVCEAQEWPPVRLSAGAAGWPTHGFRSRALQAAAPQLIFRVKTLRDRVERALNFELVLWV